MNKTSRREMLRSGTALCSYLAAVSAVPPVVSHAASKNKENSREDEYTFGHTMLFMDEYHAGTMEILNGLRGELDQIGDLSSRAANVIRNGGTVWASMNIGHMTFSEQAEGRRGNPGVLKEHGMNANVDFDLLKKGDMVFTNHCNKAVRNAHERGVYVVSVTVNYINNEFRPEGFSYPNEDDLLLKDVSNEILHSHVPYNQGLVQAPEIPEMTICPSAVTGLGALHWMLSAEIATKMGDSGARDVNKSAHYLSLLTERIEQVREHRDRIRETAVTMAHRIRAGGRWFAQSLEHPGFQSELDGVASGPMITNWGNWDDTKDRNVMLINAISPAHSEEMKLLREKKTEGAFIIGIGPSSLDGSVPSSLLIDGADAGFDNFSPESGGVITVKGRSGTICPTSGIVGNVIQQMICAQWTDEMVRRGSVPFYWMGFFQVGGRAYDDGVRPFFERQGY